MSTGCRCLVHQWQDACPAHEVVGGLRLQAKARCAEALDKAGDLFELGRDGDVQIGRQSGPAVGDHGLGAEHVPADAVASRTPATAARTLARSGDSDTSEALSYRSVGRDIRRSFGVIRPVRARLRDRTAELCGDPKGLVTTEPPFLVQPVVCLEFRDRGPVALREVDRSWRRTQRQYHRRKRSG